jgi:phospholipid-binding lipoprotein MlaA
VREDVPDRFERLNRGVYKFNRAVDRRVVRPIARGYDRVMPVPVDRHMRNFFSNLTAPLNVLHNFLQAKFKPGFSDLGRFQLGLEPHPEDFGQTLAVWGVPSGGPLMLPLLGMGTIRDWGGYTLDVHGDVLWYNHSDDPVYGLIAWRLLSDRAALLPAEAALEGSFDEYAFIRRAYMERRRYQVYDGAPPEEPEEDDPAFDVDD